MKIDLKKLIIALAPLVISALPVIKQAVKDAKVTPKA